MDRIFILLGLDLLNWIFIAQINTFTLEFDVS